MTRQHEDAIALVRDRLIADPDVVALIVIGSVARGEARDRSDVDLVVVLTEEAARLRQQVDAAIKGMARRLFARTGAETLRLATFAILDLPFAAVHRHVAANEIPPAYVDDLIAKAYQALIAQARSDNSKRGRK